MNKHIKNLVQFIGQDIVNSVDNDQNMDDYVYKYHPQTTLQLVNCIAKHIIDQNYDLNDIDVSDITDFSDLFQRFDQPEITPQILADYVSKMDLSLWDVSNGENFKYMFMIWTYDANKQNMFNCDISKWDVRNGKDFSYMFKGCANFNQDLSNWNVSNGQYFIGMFYGCTVFESNLNKWNIKNGYAFHEMFEGCMSGKIDISKWKLTDKPFDNIQTMCRDSNVDMPQPFKKTC